jgi:hypothetical protein
MDICSIIEAHEHKPDEAVLSALRIVTARDGEHCTKQDYENIAAGINNATSNASEKTKHRMHSPYSSYSAGWGVASCPLWAPLSQYSVPVASTGTNSPWGGTSPTPTEAKVGEMCLEMTDIRVYVNLFQLMSLKCIIILR